MNEYLPATYGERIAELYDDWYGDLDPAPAVGLLAELAGDGPVLELGIGTGRIALPLAARGLAVHGLDASEAMVGKLRDKPGGADLPVVMGDFARFDLEERFSLAYVAFNTFFGLLDQEDQLSCFESVAHHLLPGGRFVMECFVPDPSRFDRHQRVGAQLVGVDDFRLEVSRHDPVRQRVDSQHVLVESGRIKQLPVAIRYAWPSELDLMARLAEIDLEHRWGGWNRRAFTVDSDLHVSVYRRAA